ncbi:MAG: polyphosphate polymerase domain-containing protein [Candidatus Promineifilaceae bacterium]|nr:polyphosphate polymerase domain-containing protein [Candidatus Promineifilaceae bacterium]
MSKTERTKLFNRLEVKYLVDRPTRTALNRDLQALMPPDKHAGPQGFYRVRSLYYDTPDYMAYQQKISGQAERHKLRIRAYGDDPGQSPLIRLEVKSRYVSFIYKVVVNLSRQEYLELECALKHRQVPHQLLSNKDMSTEFVRLKHQYNFEPRILLQYRRQAYERVELNRVRVNFDDELVACRDLDILGPMRGARSLLRYGHSIFEIKVDNVLPYWLHQLISKYNLNNQAFSKFCYSVQSEARLSSVARPDLTEGGLHPTYRY